MSDTHMIVTFNSHKCIYVCKMHVFGAELSLHIAGLYVESHGIVDNYMWDEDTGDTFELGANPEALQSHWYEFAEPLWVTSTKQVSVQHVISNNVVF